MGQQIGLGNGKINSGNVELNFNLFGSPIVLKAKLSMDGNRLKGTYTMQATGEVQSITLVRSKNGAE